jgi:hypothetical protein
MATRTNDRTGFHEKGLVTTMQRVRVERDVLAKAVGINW